MKQFLCGAAVCWAVVSFVGPAAARGGQYVWKDGRWVAAPKPAEGTPEGELALIRSHVEAGRRKDALAAAERFAARYPDSPLREEAMLLAGQAELDAGRYYQAYEKFEEMIAAYPNGRLLERALSREMEVAEAFLTGKKRIVAKVFRLPAYDEGLKILRGIIEHAPGSSLAEKASMRIGRYYLDDGKFAEAADAYDEYLQLFPNGSHVAEAMLRGAEATRLSFKGVAYDETPLVEAEHRYRALLEQHPAAARRARAEEVLREIAELRAERAYKTARFYERTGRPKSAKFYYRQVIAEHPGSAWATAARQALGGEAPAAVPARPKVRPAPPVRPVATSRPAVRPKPKPEPSPAPKPGPAPAAKPKPVPAPAPKPRPAARPKPTTKPAPAPRPVGKPVDLEKLEKLPEPSPKGTSR